MLAAASALPSSKGLHRSCCYFLLGGRLLVGVVADRAAVGGVAASAGAGAVSPARFGVTVRSDGMAGGSAAAFACSANRAASAAFGVRGLA